MASLQISPSLLSANFAYLGDEIKKLEQAGADRLHLDIMDGHFVPNLTFGPPLIKDLRPHTTLPFEAHLMIKPCDPYIQAIAKAGADIILVHPESTDSLQETLHLIQAQNVKAGIVLNPTTPMDCLIPFLDQIDQVLVMSVTPGFGGQKFMPSQLLTLKTLKTLIGNRPIDIEMDGGITAENAADCHQAGANILVAGTSVFKTPAYQENIEALRNS